MPYDRKLTPEEQAGVDKSIRKCWCIASCGIMVVITIVFLIQDFI